MTVLDPPGRVEIRVAIQLRSASISTSAGVATTTEDEVDCVRTLVVASALTGSTAGEPASERTADDVIAPVAANVARAM